MGEPKMSYNYDVKELTEQEFQEIYYTTIQKKSGKHRVPVVEDVMQGL